MSGILASLYPRSWWSLLIRGIVAVVFGIAAITRPHQTLEFMVTLLGIFILVIGLLSAVGGLVHRKESRMWLLFFVPGIIAIIIGIIAVAWPGAMAAFV